MAAEAAILKILKGYFLLNHMLDGAKPWWKALGYMVSWPPGVLGIWGEWLFIFRELGSTGNYFMGAREQAHSFGDLGSPAKKQKNKKRKSLHFVRFFKKILLILGGYPPRPPLSILNVDLFIFVLDMNIQINLSQNFRYI